MSKFKIGDKIKRVCESNHEVLQGFTYTVRGFDRYGDLELGGLEDFGYNEESFEVVTGVNSQPTYTKSELSYIAELEDRVEYLESLCVDLNKIVSRKDAEITVRQQLLDFQSVEISNIRYALDKWAELAHLTAQNTKVADLLGVRIGDYVIDKIYDYLLSRVK